MGAKVCFSMFGTEAIKHSLIQNKILKSIINFLIKRLAKMDHRCYVNYKAIRKNV